MKNGFKKLLDGEDLTCSRVDGWYSGATVASCDLISSLKYMYYKVTSI